MMQSLQVPSREDEHGDPGVSSSNESLQQSRWPSLEELISYFVAAKRALAVSSHVSRANDIVARARSILESIATLDAGNVHLGESFTRQLVTLEAIRHGISHVEDDGHQSFKITLKTLDAVDAKVREILETLRKITVEPSLQPPQARSRCLYDFVDEQGVEDLADTFRDCIDHTKTALCDLQESNNALDAQIAVIHATFADNRGYDRSADMSFLARTFESLEVHATEMAELLQSLVKHYDLCTSALKHTKGGHEAAEKAQVDLSDDTALEYFGNAASTPPISEEERGEMFQVVVSDARELDDVVQELRDHSTEMEAQLSQITAFFEKLRNHRHDLRRGLHAIGEVQRTIADRIDAGLQFIRRWDEQKCRIENKIEELEGVRDFYVKFLQAYDGLLLEISRRRMVQLKMEKTAQEAMTKLTKLYSGKAIVKTTRIRLIRLADDVKEREAFKEEHGEYLPSDIWSGLVHEPPRFTIAQEGEEPLDLPEIPREALQRASKRSAT